MPTDPLTGSRYPASNAAPAVYQDIQNAVFDLSDNTVAGPFATTTARDTAFTAWVSAGGAMRDNLLSAVTGVGIQIYTSGTWRTAFPVTGALPGAVLTGTGLQTVGSATWSNIGWTGTETYDPANAHSTGTNPQRFVAPQTRLYQVSGSIQFPSNSTGRRGIRIVHNDDSAAAVSAREVIVGAVINTRLSISAGVFMSAADYVAIQMYQDSGGNLDVDRSTGQMSVVPAPLI